MPRLTPTAQISVNVYWLVTGLFGLAYGIYGYYAFVYLSRLHPEGASLLTPLLPVLAATMLFEFVAEPVTGRLADVYGRRLAVVMAFLLMSGAFIVYAAAATPRVSTEPWGVQTVAIVAELILAIGLALHSGSFDAWIVERVYEAEGTRDVNTDKIFARAGQVFTAGLTIGAFIGAFAVSHVAGDRDILSNIWPWLLSAFLALLAVLVGAAAMVERPNIRAPQWTESASIRSFLLDSGRRVLALRHQTAPVIQVIVVNSSLYAIGIVYIYFSTLVAERTLRLFDLADFLYWMPFLYLVPRLAGPQLAIVVTRGLHHSNHEGYARLLRITGVLCAVSASLLAVTASALVGSTEVPPHGWLYLGLGSVAFFATSFFVHMAKPISTAYLNYHIVEDADRAFVNSMATPAGGMLVALTCVAILLSTGRATSPTSVDTLAIFLVPAIVAAVAVTLATKPLRAQQ